MFAIPGIIALLTFIYARPHEFVEAFRALPLLYVFCGMATFGLLVDLRLRVLRAELSPHFLWVMLFAAWALFTAAAKNSSSLPSGLLLIAIILLLYFVVAHGVQTFRGLEAVIAVLLACVVLISAVGVHQGVAPFGCIAIDARNASELVSGRPDGRSCVTRLDCISDDSEPGIDFLCERVGLFGTTTIGGGRVRYLGVLQDPNEMSLAICVGLPFAIAFFERKKNTFRLALLVVTFTLVAICTVFTQSRGGQLVFLTVMGSYFFRRFGVRGLVAGAVLAAPMLLFGGRSGEEAESSSLERLECWYEGMSMWKEAPILGVGLKQFTEHHYLTAHNSYVLAAAELGFPGFVLWANVLYISTKIPVEALRRLAPSPENEVARIWGMALLTSCLGLLVGVFFLSFCYHYILWIYIGLTGGFYAAVRTHDPSFRVRFGPRDLAAVVGMVTLMIIILYAYTRAKAP